MVEELVTISARVFARTLGISIRGSLGIILEGLKRGIISRTKALIALEKLSDVMYLSADSIGSSGRKSKRRSRVISIYLW